jgi:class 3 adenylate cyclase
LTQAPDTAQQALVETAAAALERHEWRAAFDGLAAADAEQPLSPEALELLATAAWWTGQLPLAIETRERAFAIASKAGDLQTAVLVAINLARDYFFKLAMPTATAWIKRAERMLEGLEENLGHGWVAAVKAGIASMDGNTEESIAQAKLAQEVSERLGLPDLRAYALATRAAGLMAMGEVDEGLALADEAATAAISGELEPAVAGGVFCATIEACAGIGDVKRALEWTEAQDRWCRREHINGFPGMCRIFRSDVKRMHGAWPEAEAEALQASVELRGYIPGAAGLALYQVGEIRLRRGDLPAAEEALLNAYALGQDTEPAQSLLRLAQGKTAGAVESIRRALNEPGRSSWRAPSDSAVYRVMLLPAQVEILLAAGDVAGARASADELATLAEKFRTPSVLASAASAAGLVALAEGKAEEAATRLRAAIGLWVGVDAPFEAAQMRLALADAYRASGQPDLGAIEARTARDAFEQLGAALDLRHAEDVVASFSAEGAAPLGMATARVERAFMFTDIVDSTKLAETLGDEAWDGVLRSHDKTLRTAIAEHGGEVVKATGDGFFLAFADADLAIQAAIAIQKRLADQRRSQGFALAVRIGIHSAQANRVGLDYIGSGVNQAARIGAAASGGEILVSATTLASASHPFREGARRTVTLKGLSEPVEVAQITWE